jgi:hypothetical protein
MNGSKNSSLKPILKQALARLALCLLPSALSLGAMFLAHALSFLAECSYNRKAPIPCIFLEHDIGSLISALSAYGQLGFILGAVFFACVLAVFAITFWWGYTRNPQKHA